MDFAVYIRYMPSRRLRRLDTPLVMPIDSAVRDVAYATIGSKFVPLSYNIYTHARAIFTCSIPFGFALISIFMIVKHPLMRTVCTRPFL
jgi:hypothetical protein